MAAILDRNLVQLIHILIKCNLKLRVYKFVIAHKTMVKTDRIPESHIDLFRGKHIAYVATLNPDNSPQISPIWIDYDQEREREREYCV